jgi:DNA primase
VGILAEDIARVREATDFVQLASEHLALKKVGQRWIGLCPFHAEKTPSFSVNASEGLYYCLAGETGVLTWDGIRPIRDLAGGTHRILTEKGRWVEAPFRSFGVQPLMKVTVTRNQQRKVLYATPEHRWLVRGRSPHRFERATKELRPGHPLAWSFPPSHVRQLGDLSPQGICHGITYGDGSRFAGAASVDLHGDKDAQLLKWFPLNRTYSLTSHTGKPFLKVLDLPKYFKDRPSLDEAPTYLAGWLAGYIAADGHVSKDGTCMLNSADRNDLEFVRRVCTRLGIGTYGITGQERVGFEGREPSTLYRVHFIAEDLDERFFLISKHRDRFVAAKKSWVRRGWMVESVEPSDRVEEVFCAEVDGTHNFTLEDNILTGNCFGCQAKGDVITFVREIDHLEFAEAVEVLAAKAGIQVRYDQAAVSRDHQRRDRLVEVMKQAVEWYHQRLLAGDDGAAARSYLRSRGYDGDVVRQFQLGWAPDDWDALARTLKVPDDILRDTGLGFVNRRNRQQDAFRGRVMFPIFDSRGEPVAFSGRALPGADGPKYKNSAESPLYSKSKVLYGLNWAKADVVRAGEVIVCEGSTDVIGFFLAGVPRAVAGWGTALTEDQIRTLKNFARRLVLAYDADTAGQAAAERLYEWERKYEVDIAVADLPPGSDPADLARSDPERLRAAVEQARPFLAFRIERALSAASLSMPEGRARAAEAALDMIREHPDEFVRDQYVMEVSARTRIEADRLREALKKGRLTSAPTRASTPTRASRIVLSRSAEEEALLLAVHDRDAMQARLHEVLFADELTAAAYRALMSTDSLHEALAVADPAAADMLQRLAVEEPSQDADNVVGRLAREAGIRALRELEIAARDSDDPAAFAPAMGWLKLTVDELRDPGSAVDASDRLVRWLVDRLEVEA